MTRDNNAHTSYGFALGMICGVAVGAAVGLLFAPTSGRELRGKIGDGARKVGSQSRDLYESARRTVSDAVSTGREAYQKVRTDHVTSHS